MLRENFDLDKAVAEHLRHNYGTRALALAKMAFEENDLVLEVRHGAPHAATGGSSESRAQRGVASHCRRALGGLGSAAAGSHGGAASSAHWRSAGLPHVNSAPRDLLPTSLPLSRLVGPASPSGSPTNTPSSRPR